MTAEQRAELQKTLRGGQAARRDPVRPARLADQGVRDRERQGRRRQVVGDGEPRPGDGQGRDAQVGIVDADIYGHSVPAMLGIADSRPTQVEDLIMPVPTPSGRLA